MIWARGRWRAVWGAARGQPALTSLHDPLARPGQHPGLDFPGCGRWKESSAPGPCVLLRSPWQCSKSLGSAVIPVLVNSLPDKVLSLVLHCPHLRMMVVAPLIRFLAEQTRPCKASAWPLTPPHSQLLILILMPSFQCVPVVLKEGSCSVCIPIFVQLLLFLCSCSGMIS